MKKQPLVIGEHRSPARRRAWRRYASRHAARNRARASAWYWAHREGAIARQRGYRAKQWPARQFGWGRNHLSDRDWDDIRRYYEQVRASGESLTFKQLGAHFWVSKDAIGRRSRKEGGWSRRFTPERPPS